MENIEKIEQETAVKETRMYETDVLNAVYDKYRGELEEIDDISWKIEEDIYKLEYNLWDNDIESIARTYVLNNRGILLRWRPYVMLKQKDSHIEFLIIDKDEALLLQELPIAEEIVKRQASIYAKYENHPKSKEIGDLDRVTKFKILPLVAQFYETVLIKILTGGTDV